MNAEVIAHALGGRRAGVTWMARCPAHDDREPSLAITDSDGKVLVRCHAGCDQRDLIAALRARGLWERKRSQVQLLGRGDGQLPAKPDSDAIRRTEAALAVWRASRPAEGTPVETYLRSRGLAIPVLRPSIRFHAGLRHPTGTIWPAMVALVIRGVDGKPIGIHRTFLARDGSGKATAEPAKMMLGLCRGGVVRLGQPNHVLMVGEGIETCLAAQQATGNAAWAALSTSGLCALNLPQEIRDVIVLADGDDAGETAAQRCSLRWKQEGRRVRVARPPKGMDFNDLLLRYGALTEGFQR